MRWYGQSHGFHSPPKGIAPNPQRFGGFGAVPLVRCQSKFELRLLRIFGRGQRRVARWAFGSRRTGLCRPLPLRGKILGKDPCALTEDEGSLKTVLEFAYIARKIIFAPVSYTHLRAHETVLD